MENRQHQGSHAESRRATTHPCTSTSSSTRIGTSSSPRIGVTDTSGTAASACNYAGAGLSTNVPASDNLSTSAHACARVECAARSAKGLMEDLELRILMQRLTVVERQRELAAFKCQQFMDYLEASLGTPQESCGDASGGPDAACTSGALKATATAGRAMGETQLEGCWSCPMLSPTTIGRRIEGATVPWSTVSSDVDLGLAARQGKKLQRSQWRTIAHSKVLLC